MAHGATAILSETPEIYGAEHLLTRRAISQAVGQKLVARIKWLDVYTRLFNGSMDNSPSPGNSWNEAIREHKAIFKAIQAQDPVAAREAIREHMDSAYRRFSVSWDDAREH